ncbi:MAG: 3-deoxy-7-phosphoheptulonate synthase [Eggerthellaceae bacterium]|nr:3-deoxy-7-phosphoheptulonate synthase [Eggerthellaceae bacterium]
MRMDFHHKLPSAIDIKTQYPVNEGMAKVKAARDAEIMKVFEGKSEKFLLVIGPCSADHTDAVLEYASRLSEVENQVGDQIIIIPRIYTNKPRTTGEGYKGMLHQPDPKQKPDMIQGILAIRNLHMTLLRKFGFSCADEMLYPDNHPYLSDLLSYVAVGARSVENQQHRLAASGLDIPAGMKNPTSGDVSIMMNAIRAAQHSHTFIYRNWEVESLGNSLSHAILRGYQDSKGRLVSNYHYETLRRVYDIYKISGLKNPAVIVDCNHANSGKKCLEQIRISKDVLFSRRQDGEMKDMVKGIMIESYLVDGAQKTEGSIFGQSITDPCLGWEKSEKLIFELAEELQK